LETGSGYPKDAGLPGIDEMPCNEGMEANQARRWKQIKVLQFLVQKITVCVRNDQMLEVNALGALEFKS